MEDYKVYYDQDADIKLLEGKKLAVIGYGSQGHAHSLNLKESGLDVIVGLREGSASIQKAQNDGLTVKTTAEAVKEGDMIMILAPDQLQKEIYDQDIAPNLSPGNIIAFGHGFNIHYSQINPPKDVDVVMIAPKGPGHLVRRVYVEGTGVPCLIAVHNDASKKAKEYALAWAKGIGGTRAGVIETNFKDETETDLFGEQVVLCGGLTELIRAGFDTLVEAGYPPQICYFECLHELKLIVDLLYEGGINYMNYSVSETAEYGGLIRGPQIINDDARKEMRRTLKEIQDGTFARDWLVDNKVGQAGFKALRAKSESHPVEVVGAKLRQMFSWLKK